MAHWIPTLTEPLIVSVASGMTFVTVLYLRLRFPWRDDAPAWQRLVGWIAEELSGFLWRLFEALLAAVMIGVATARGWLGELVTAALHWLLT